MRPDSIASKSWLPADCAEVIAGIEAGLDLTARADVEARLLGLIEDHERHMDRETLGLNAGTLVFRPYVDRRFTLGWQAGPIENFES